MRRSPIRLQKKYDPLLLALAKRRGTDIKSVPYSWRWAAVGPLRAALLRSKKDPRRYAILHRSTRNLGKWQLTLFDECGPFGDINRATPQDALVEGLDGWGSGRTWRLESVVTADGKTYGKPV